MARWRGQGDFLEMILRVNCHSIPEGDQVCLTVRSIAQEEITQEPKYTLDEITSTVRESLRMFLPNQDVTHEIYESKKPSARKIIKMLDSNPIDEDRSTSLSYLKKFIKGLDDTIFKTILSFFTGAEMIYT